MGGRLPSNACEAPPFRTVFVEKLWTASSCVRTMNMGGESTGDRDEAQRQWGGRQAYAGHVYQSASCPYETPTTTTISSTVRIIDM